MTQIKETVSKVKTDISGKWVSIEEVEKLAETIVKECCDILDPGEHQLIARFQARKFLIEHFGVKE